MGLIWFLGSLDGSGKIWKRFLICVMLSNIYVIGTKIRLTEVNTSLTDSRRALFP